MRRRHLVSAVVTVAVLFGNAFAAGDWKVEALPANLPLASQSCLTTYSFVGHMSENGVFLDESTDDKARANIRLGGKVFDLVLVSSKRSGKDGPDSTGPGSQSDRVFKDKTGAVVVETVVKVTAEHPEADSVEMVGSLTAKYLGKTQTVRIEGGVAC
ncbi:MAG TPA: hypothetical protein VHZ78_15150 [Rhizomicrobium sp.]|jgi:hypothetical protein|nr:hypothetical protein [Rhizomicrobium sp.]